MIARRPVYPSCNVIASPPVIRSDEPRGQNGTEAEPDLPDDLPRRGSVRIGEVPRLRLDAGQQAPNEGPDIRTAAVWPMVRDPDRHRRRGGPANADLNPCGHGSYTASAYSTVVVGSGISSPFIRMPSRWNGIASRIRRSASSRV